MSKSNPQPTFIYGISIKDERGKQKICQLCNTKFGLANAEHQCKRCKRAVCEKCAAYKAIVQKLDQQSKKPHRQCNVCKQEAEEMKRFAEQYKVAFNTDSAFVDHWLQSYGTDPAKAKQHFREALEEAKKASDTNQADVLRAKIDVLLQEIDCFLNYSLKEFALLAHGPLDQGKKDMVKQAILRTSGTFLLLYPEVGYSHEVVMIAYFLLCFSNEASAYLLLTIIYAHILPPYLYPKQYSTTRYNFLNEVAMIIGICKDAFGIGQNDIPVIEAFMKDRIRKYQLQLGINLYLFETTFFMFNQLFENPNEGYYDFIKILAITCAQSNTEIQKVKTQYDECEVAILRTVRSSQLMTAFKTAQKLNLENYKKEQVVLRSSSINTRSLSLATEKPNPNQIQTDLLQLVDQNKKLTQKLHENEEKVKDLEETIESYQSKETQSAEDIAYLKQSLQKVQDQNDLYLAELSIYREAGNSQPKDSTTEALIKQNRQLQAQLEKKDQDLQLFQSAGIGEKFELEKLALIREKEIIETKLNERTIDVERLNETLELNQVQLERLKKQIEEQAILKGELEERVLELDKQNSALLKKVDTLTFELSLSNSMKAQEGYEQVFKEEMAKINREFEQQQLVVNDLNVVKLRLERQIADLQQQAQLSEQAHQDAVLILNQKIQAWEAKCQKQEQAYSDLINQSKDRARTFEEEISLLKIQNETFAKKVEQQEALATQLATLQGEKQQQTKELRKAMFEIEQLRLEATSKEPADTGSADYQNSVAQQLQQKNEDIAVLSELNSELLLKTSAQEKQIEELNIQVINLQRAIKTKNSNDEVQQLKEVNTELLLQVEEQRLTQQELLEQLNSIPNARPQLFQFAESSRIQARAKDSDDAKNVLEIKNFQNQILKGLLTENQQQIQQLTATLEVFKSILTRPPRYSVCSK